MHYPRVSFANVVSCLALFVALGGVSYAAVALPKNSVGTTQIRSASIDNSKVKKGSLLKSSFKRGQLPTGKRGAKGATGAAGAAQTGAPKLAANGFYPAQDIPGDSEWHDYVRLIFTAAADTIYVPNNFAVYSNARLTGADCGVDSLGVQTRAVVNGTDVSPVDTNGYQSPPQFFGPYPAGTAIDLEMQWKLDCATQNWHTPTGDFALVPYQTP